MKTTARRIKKLEHTCPNCGQSMRLCCVSCKNSGDDYLKEYSEYQQRLVDALQKAAKESKLATDSEAESARVRFQELLNS